LHEELEALAYSDLSGLDVVDLFAGSVYESLRRHAGCREGVTVTCTILRYGSKELVHLSLGNKERYEDWLEHFRDPVRRGLKAPVTALRTVRRGWSGQWRPRGSRQSTSAAGSTRCGMCCTRTPQEVQPLLKPYLEAIRDAPDVERVRRLVGEVVKRWLGCGCPSAMRSLHEDLEASLPHLVLPAAHLEHVGTTNMVERNFEKKRRLHKVLLRFPSDREYLKLVFAVLGGPANAGGGWSSARTSRGSDSGQ
jgi:transposase-like protein